MLKILILILCICDSFESGFNLLFKNDHVFNRLVLNETQFIVFQNSFSSYYSNLILKGSYLYLSGTDYVFKLNANQISNDITYKERNLKPTNKNDLNLIKNFNYIKYLSPRESTKDLIVCGTNLGKPHIYDLKEDDLTNQLEYNGDYLCAGLANYKSLNLIDLKGISKYGIMYSGIWITERASQTYGIFSRYGIFRKEIEINRHFLRSLYSPYWLWEPSFISILQDEKYVYYFFSEISIENFNFKYPNYDLNSLNDLSNFTLNNSDLIRFSRVARICKNDKGATGKTETHLNDMWTTFRKIRLECNCETNQSNFKLNLNNLKFIKQFGSKIYAIFHEPLLNPQNGNVNIYSILCEYDFDLIRSKLEYKHFKSLKTNIKEDDSPNSRLNEDFDCSYFDEQTNDDNTDDMLKENLKFLTENTILDTNLDGECKLALPYELTTLTVNKLNSNDEALFLMASIHSHLVRVVKKESTFEVLSILNINQTTNLTSQEILEMLSSDNAKQIYLSSRYGVYQLDMTFLNKLICNNYVSCIDCNKDPFCVWNVTSCIWNKEMNKSQSNCLKNVNLKEDSFFVEIEMNETLVLNCLNSLNSMINWLRNGSRIEYKSNEFLTDKGQLIIKNFNETNIGYYSCEINNNFIKTYNVSISYKRVQKEVSINDKINDTVVLENMFINWNKIMSKFNNQLEEKFQNCSTKCTC